MDGLLSDWTLTVTMPVPAAERSEAQLREPFFGLHQGGIATPQQTHSYFAAFDCLAKSRDELATMLRSLGLDGPVRMSYRRDCPRSGTNESGVEGPDGGSALDLSSGRLTITFGFGAGLFSKDGSDRVPALPA